MVKKKIISMFIILLMLVTILNASFAKNIAKNVNEKKLEDNKITNHITDEEIQKAISSIVNTNNDDSEYGEIEISYNSPGPEPSGIGFDVFFPEFLWIADKQDNKITAVDPFSGRVIKSYDLPGIEPIGVAFHSMEKRLYISDYGTKKIYVINSNTGDNIKSFDRSEDTICGGLTTDYQHLIYGCRKNGNGYYLFLDLDTGKVKKSIKTNSTLPYYHMGLAWDTNYIWDNGILVSPISLDYSRDNPRLVNGHIPQSGDCGLACIGPNYLIVSDSEDQQIHIINIKRDELEIKTSPEDATTIHYLLDDFYDGEKLWVDDQHEYPIKVNVPDDLVFQKWTVSSNIDIDDEYSTETSFTINGDGWIQAVLQPCPNPPDKPSGSLSIAINSLTEFSTKTIDPNGDRVKYRFDWGDGDISSWTDFVNSGETVTKTHKWSSSGSFNIKAQAMDEQGAYSDWGDEKTVYVLEADAHGNYKGFTDYWIKFNGEAKGGVGPYTYHWKFGDGSTSDKEDPKHTYSSAYTYTAELTVTDSEGTSQTDVVSVRIKDIPVWVEAAIKLAGDKNWDGNHLHSEFSFNDFQDLISIVGSVPGQVNLKKFSGDYDLTFNWEDMVMKIDLYANNPNKDKVTLTGSAGVDIDAYDSLSISSGVRYNFDKVGDNLNWELCIYLNGRYEYPAFYFATAVGPVPVSAEANLYFNAGVDFNLNSPNKYNNNCFKSVNGKIGVGAELKGGVGICGAASAGLYTDVSGNWRFKAPESGDSIYDDFQVSISFGAYAELIFVIDARWEWWSASWPNYMQAETPTSINSNWEYMPRNYGNPSWVNNEDGLLLEDAFPKSHPSIARNSNGEKMMVWTQDDLSKGANGDGLDIWFSKWNKNTDSWNTPKRVTNDNLAQSNPSIALLDNGDAICVFNCLESTVADKTILEVAKNSEIGYCYWDGSSWSEPNLIGATNHSTDSYPVISASDNKAAVVWMCDTNPDISQGGITVNDRFLYGSFWNKNQWTMPQVISNDNIVSIPVSLSYNGVEAACAYVADANGLLTNNDNPDIDDHDVYIKTFTLMNQLTTTSNNIKITNGGRNAYPSINYLNNAAPSVSWMKEDPEDHTVDVLFEDSIGTLKTLDGPETVFSNLKQGSSTALFSGGTGVLQETTATLPVVAWSDGKNLCYSRKFNQGWEDIQLLHMTDKKITQATWEYDISGDEIGAIIIEKEKTGSIQNCEMYEAGKKEMLHPPKPMISGPGQGVINRDYTFRTSTSDPSPNKQLKYFWDWNGDKQVDEETDWIISGEIIEKTHKWTNEGNYNVYVRATNGYKTSQWSDPLNIEISEQNFPPTKPNLNGPSTGEKDVKYSYTLVSTDAENDNIYYYVKWGDGTNSGWKGPYDSGEQITLKHKWSERDTYTIKAKAKDSNGQETGWTTLSVEIPKNKDKNLNLFLEIISKCPRLFNIIERLFQKILQIRY